ncbi:MAG: NAD(P)/FAD-dependent oxidoreductase [Alphaproteobacteria bacterium]|nr:NAD(P)/FAD-dependent oxidoreductase [Alphaproteobacteria bacterium]
MTETAPPAQPLSAPETRRTDVLVIGAGPVGLFQVFECGMLGFRCHVVDSLEEIGGQCVALYPEKPIYDIPGFPSVDAADLIERLEAQAAPFEPVYHLGQQVVRLEGDAESGFTATTSAGTVIEAKAVSIAAGAGAFGPNRPPLEGLETYEGTSVFYLVKRREDFRDKAVVIAGGGDSAVDWANALHGTARKIYVVHRRDKFRAAPDMVARMRGLEETGALEMVVPYQLKGLEGAEGRLTGVRVATLKGEERVLEADVLLPFFGLATNLGPIADWGIELEKNQILVDPTTMRTNRPGIFSVGDINTYPGKLKLIVTGFSEGALAAHAMHPLLRPGEALHFEYSTTKGVPAAS